MIERIMRKVEPFGFNRYIVSKVFKRNNEIIECKTYYFNSKDYFRKYLIKGDKTKEISYIVENGEVLQGSKNSINFLV